MTRFDEAWLRDYQARRSAPVRVIDRDAIASSPSVAPAGGRSETPAPIQRPEQDLQIAVATFLDWSLPPPWRWMHIPNGEKRSPIIAKILKAMGVKKGAADCLILGPRPGFIWLELKSAEGRLSAEQKDWRDWCRSIGAPWFCCRSLDDVCEALTSCGITLLGRPQ